MKNNILEYLTESVEKFPNKTCFGDKNGSLTFKELEHLSMSLGYSVLEQTQGRTGIPIPVFLEKGIQSIVAFIAIVMSGNFYVPIDMKSPVERKKGILKLLEAGVIVTSRDGGSTLDGENILLEQIFVDDLTEDDPVNADVFTEIRKKKIGADPLYILFTSGTTGTPKGVVISHRSVIDYIEWLSQEFGFSDKNILANQAPFYFDNSIFDIYLTLRNGCTTWIVPEERFLFPNQTLSYLQQKKINTIFWVPSALALVANSGALSNPKKENLPELDKILFCGEVMHNKHLNIWRKAFPNASFANLYGPTEITDVCSYYLVDREFDDSEPLPIGRPCNNTEILVLNEQDRLAEVGEIGELCVRGECLSLGYYKDPDRTDAVFVQNPTNLNYRDLIYRTGDHVKYNERGEVIFLGRKDHQIKHMGHRIELGEIETATQSLDNVERCCAIYDEEKQKLILVCIVSQAEESPVDEKKIYQELKAILPSYMLPHIIRLVDAMPLNANGKTDRKKLKATLS